MGKILGYDRVVIDHLCILWGFGVTKFMWNEKLQLSLSQDLTNAYLWAIPKKQEDTTYTILLRGKCLSLELKFSWKRTLFPKESMRGNLEEIQESESIDTPMEELE